MSDNSMSSGEEDGLLDNGNGSEERIRQTNNGSGMRRTDTLNEDALRARVRRLETENAQLRDQYSTIQMARNTRMAVGFGVIGLFAGSLAFVFPSVREVLIVVSMTGLFAGLLTRFLDPNRHVALNVGRGIYTTIVQNEVDLVSQLSLSDARIYVATDDGPRLFIPEVEDYNSTALDELSAGPLVVSDDASRSGLVFRPTGEALLDVVQDSSDDHFSSELSVIVETLSESVTDAIELTEHVESDVNAEDGRATFVARGVLYGDPTHFDHPLGSLFGSGLALALDTPVRVTVGEAKQGATLVTCQWTPAE